MFDSKTKATVIRTLTSLVLRWTLNKKLSYEDAAQTLEDLAAEIRLNNAGGQNANS